MSKRIAKADASEAQVVVVSASGRRRIEGGYPWVYRQDIKSGPTEDARTGGPLCVRVLDDHGAEMGLASWATESPVALRILERTQPLDRGNTRGRFAETTSDEGEIAGAGGGTGAVSRFSELVNSRIERSIAFRKQLGLNRSAFRLIHGEGDDLPGLFVDRYEDALVVQAASVAMDAQIPSIVNRLVSLCRPKVIVARNDGSMRAFEGLPRERSVVWPNAMPSGESVNTWQVRYRFGQVLFESDLMSDGKTGGFLDQAENHAHVANFAPAGCRVLDVFSFHGGFALALAPKALKVLAVDADKTAVERIAKNCVLNGFSNVESKQADAFQLLAELESSRRQFGVVVLDPPALAKRSSDLKAAERGYGELLLRGFRLVEPGGLVVACCCSGQVDRQHWDEIVVRAAARANRSIQVLARRGAGPDHPERLGVPETGHLKCWVLRAL